jgi:rare lipoprotein A
MPKKESTPVATPPAEYSEEGLATYYAADFHGRKTSNGEIFDMNKPSAAHISLPFGTVVRVTNLSNNKSITVRINDRMPPNNKGRIIDLSLAAAREIELVAQGVAKVRVEVISK